MDGLKKKVKEQIKQVPCGNIIYAFVVFLFAIPIMAKLPLHIDGNACILIYLGMLIAACVFSKSFRALVLVAVSVVYYIFIALPTKLSNKYESLDEKNKKKVHTVGLFIGSICAGALFRNILENLSSGSGSGVNSSDTTFVEPHEVSGYTRKDGTVVDSYWRDGDANPLTTLTKENGGGYFRKK